MAKRYVGRYNAHHIVSSSMGRLDAQPDDDQLELMRIARQTDMRISIERELYEHEQRIARMRASLERFRNRR